MPTKSARVTAERSWEQLRWVSQRIWTDNPSYAAMPESNTQPGAKYAGELSPPSNRFRSACSPLLIADRRLPQHSFR